jgi:hypothetical protein
MKIGHWLFWVFLSVLVIILTVFLTALSIIGFLQAMHLRGGFPWDYSALLSGCILTLSYAVILLQHIGPPPQITTGAEAQTQGIGGKRAKLLHVLAYWTMLFGLAVVLFSLYNSLSLPSTVLENAGIFSPDLVFFAIIFVYAWTTKHFLLKGKEREA